MEAAFVYHPAQSRGFANHGWLQARHSFSFAQYYDPERIHFGVLRVLNDDVIAGGMGFGTHPHDNMEIITIPLQGALAHRDSMGHAEVIHAGDIQVMSAGTGITHSEYNHLMDQACSLLQIWVIPHTRNVTPRYDQMTLNLVDSHNLWQQIVSPNSNDAGLWIHQDAWFQWGRFESGVQSQYSLHSPDHGVYVFVVEGSVHVQGHDMQRRDGLGLWNIPQLDLKATSPNTQVLLMEVPMSLPRI